MTTRISLRLPTSRQTDYFFIFAILIFAGAFIVKGQPEFSKNGAPFFNKNFIPGSMKYPLPAEKFSMPETSSQNRPLLADGDLDSTFNASVTEGTGYVSKTVVQPDGKIIAVGYFQRVNGIRKSSITRLNADGTLDTSFITGTGITQQASFPVVALQPDGKILIGGVYIYNGQAINALARLNSDGSLDSTFNAWGGIFSLNDILVLPNGKILICGNFPGRSGVIRLNSNGTYDAEIDLVGGDVETIALAPDGKIVVGGNFYQPRNNVARFNADLTLDTTFNPTTGSNGYSVNKVIVQPNGKILAAGDFLTFNGVATEGLIRLNDNGSVDTTFDFTNETPRFLRVTSIALQSDGRILADYNYTYNTYQYSIDVRRFNPDGTTDTTFNTNTDNNLYAFDLNILPDGSILVGGSFFQINNQQHLRLVKLNSNGSLVNSFNPAFSSVGTIYAIEKQPDGKTLIAGNFFYVNGVTKNLIARLNPDGSLDNSFTTSPELGGTIYDIVVQPNGKIIIGGIFGGSEHFPAFGLARLNSDGSYDADLNNNSNFRMNAAYALTPQSDGKILVGGEIYTRTVNPPPVIFRLNTDGSLDSSFNAATRTNNSTIVRDILVQPTGKIVIGGSFNPQTNFQRQNIARLNADGTLDSVFSSTIQQDIYSLAQQSDNKVYAGGFGFYRYSSEGIPDSTYNTASITNRTVYDIAIQSNGKILIGGYSNSPVNPIVRINDNGTIDSTFNANTPGTIYALNSQSDGKTLVGGAFLDFNGTEKLSIVRLQNSAIRKPTPFDFDGDGKTDVSIFRPNSGEWWYYRSSDGQVPAVRFGSGTDKIVPGDYTGDGKTDVAFWQPSSGYWFIVRSENNSFFSFPFGTSGDVPVPADYDGDGKTDPAVFRPSTNTWYISLTSGGTSIFQFGTGGDVPVVGDYDGDGKADAAIFRPSNGQWWISRSTAGLAVATFGTATDKPVQGDYTGDGKTDIAIWRPSTGEWFILRSEDSSFFSIPFGTNGDTPVAGDYDGDGKFDFAVFRPSGSTWYINRSTAGLAIQQFGLASDRPVPAAFVP